MLKNKENKNNLLILKISWVLLWKTLYFHQNSENCLYSNLNLLWWGFSEWPWITTLLKPKIVPSSGRIYACPGYPYDLPIQSCHWILMARPPSCPPSAPQSGAVSFAFRGRCSGATNNWPAGGDPRTRDYWFHWISWSCWHRNHRNPDWTHSQNRNRNTNRDLLGPCGFGPRNRETPDLGWPPHGIAAGGDAISEGDHESWNRLHPHPVSPAASAHCTPCGPSSESRLSPLWYFDSPKCKTTV